MRIKQNAGVPHTLIVLGFTLGTIPDLIPAAKALAHCLASVGIGVVSVYQEVFVVVIVFLKVVLEGRRVRRLVGSLGGG